MMNLLRINACCPICKSDESVFAFEELGSFEILKELGFLDLFTWKCSNCMKKFFLKYSFIVYEEEQQRAHWTHLLFDERIVHNECDGEIDMNHEIELAFKRRKEEREKRESEEEYWEVSNFPWEDVKSCIDNVIVPPKGREGDICPKCAKKLVWINFSSPSWTWENYMGRAGYLSICPECEIQVRFYCTMKN